MCPHSLTCPDSRRESLSHPPQAVGGRPGPPCWTPRSQGLSQLPRGQQSPTAGTRGPGLRRQGSLCAWRIPTPRALDLACRPDDKPSKWALVHTRRRQNGPSTQMPRGDPERLCDRHRVGPLQRGGCFPTHPDSPGGHRRQPRPKGAPPSGIGQGHQCGSVLVGTDVRGGR